MNLIYNRNRIFHRIIHYKAPMRLMVLNFSFTKINYPMKYSDAICMSREHLLALLKGLK